MKYAIWRDDLPASAATFETEADALAAVRAAIEARGSGFVSGWSLILVPDEGDWETVVEGTDLAERAARVPAASSGTSPRRRPA